MSATPAAVTTTIGIAELSHRTGLSKDTLRWYEREGVIPIVERDASGYRAYDEATARIIELVVRLRRTGMSVQDSRSFAAMVGEGASSHGRRMALLEQHREHVVADLARVKEDLTAVENKISHYAGLIDRGLDCSEQPLPTPAMRTAQRSTT